MRISELGEFGLIRHLVEVAKDGLGVGDDCAVIPTAGEDEFYLTTDLLVEDVHFRLSTTSAHSLGWKSLAVSLSDLAAMGGEAVGVLVGLQLPRQTPVKLVEEIYAGISALGNEFSCPILGGDTVSSKQLAIGTTVIGKGKQAVLRSGARAGDLLWVSGKVGGSGLGLQILESGAANLNAEEKSFVAKHLTPMPRLALGRKLRGLATSMIDVSDGLLQDLSHIIKSSELQCEVNLEELPHCGDDPLVAATLGEDYELLFSTPESSRAELEALQFDVSCIGRFSRGEPGVFLNSSKLLRVPAAQALKASNSKAGFEHF